MVSRFRHYCHFFCWRGALLIHLNDEKVLPSTPPLSLFMSLSLPLCLSVSVSLPHIHFPYPQLSLSFSISLIHTNTYTYTHAHRLVCGSSVFNMNSLIMTCFLFTWRHEGHSKLTSKVLFCYIFLFFITRAQPNNYAIAPLSWCAFVFVFQRSLGTFRAQSE